MFGTAAFVRALRIIPVDVSEARQALRRVAAEGAVLEPVLARLRMDDMSGSQLKAAISAMLTEALRLRAKTGDDEAAAAALDAAIRDTNTPANAWRGYGLLRRKLGQEAEARELLTEYLRRAPNAPDRDLVRRSLAG